jgi:hypothetical protein
MLLHVLKIKVKKPTIVSQIFHAYDNKRKLGKLGRLFFAQSKCSNNYENIQHILQFLFKIQNKQMILSIFLRLVLI